MTPMRLIAPPPGRVTGTRPSVTYMILIRGMDIVVSLLLMAALSPLMLAIAAVVLCQRSGPVLYRQERLGLHGELFILLKFRSMRADAEAAGPAWACVGDRRITRVGRVLRRTRLDELPQLWNVLRGDMALVGPRPERAYFAELITERIPGFPLRLLVKPGLTGWAQVNLPYGASIEDARAKLDYDLDYIRNQGFRMTAVVLVRTVAVMVSRGGR